MRNGKTFFLSPLDNQAQQDKFIQNSLAAETHNNKLEEQKNQEVKIIRANSLNQLVQRLEEVKQCGRTPLIISSVESKIENSNLIDALQNDGSPSRNITQLFLKDLTLQSKYLAYEKRQTFIESEFQLQSNLLHRAIIGDEPTQIMINFDQGEQETQPTGQNINADVELAAKEWKHMYDADYNLLFNKIIFTPELLQGSKIGDHMIVKYGLFDEHLAAENIVLS